MIEGAVAPVVDGLKALSQQQGALLGSAFEDLVATLQLHYGAPFAIETTLMLKRTERAPPSVCPKVRFGTRQTRLRRRREASCGGRSTVSHWRRCRQSESCRRALQAV